MKRGREGKEPEPESRWPGVVAISTLVLVAAMLARDALLGPGVLGHPGAQTLGRLFMVGQLDRWLDGTDPLGRTSLLGAPGTLPAWPIDVVTTAFAWVVRGIAGGTLGAEAFAVALAAAALLVLSGIATYALARAASASALSATAAGAVVMLQPHALTEVDGGALEALGAGPLALAILALGLHLDRPPAWTPLRVAACVGSGILFAGTAPYAVAHSMVVGVVAVLAAGGQRVRLLPGWLPGGGALLAGIALVLVPLVAVEVSEGGRFDTAENPAATAQQLDPGVVVDGRWVPVPSASEISPGAAAPRPGPADAAPAAGAPRAPPAWTKVFERLPWSLAAAACAVVALLGRRGRVLGIASLAIVLAGPGWADAATTIAAGGPVAPSPLHVFVALVPGGSALGDIHRVLAPATLLAAVGAAVVLGSEGGAESRRGRERQAEQGRGPRGGESPAEGRAEVGRLRFKTGTEGAGGRRGRRGRAGAAGEAAAVPGEAWPGPEHRRPNAPPYHGPERRSGASAGAPGEAGADAATGAAYSGPERRRPNAPPYHGPERLRHEEGREPERPWRRWQRGGGAGGGEGGGEGEGEGPRRRRQRQEAAQGAEGEGRGRGRWRQQEQGAEDEPGPGEAPGRWRQRQEGSEGEAGHGQGRWAQRRAEREQRRRVDVAVATPSPSGGPSTLPDVEAEIEEGPTHDTPSNAPTLDGAPTRDGPASPTLHDETGNPETTAQLPSGPGAPGRIYRASDADRGKTPRERRQERWEEERQQREARQEARRAERQAAQEIRQAERQQRRAEEEARRAAAGATEAAGGAEAEAETQRTGPGGRHRGRGAEERQAHRAQRRRGGEKEHARAEGVRRKAQGGGRGQRAEGGGRQGGPGGPGGGEDKPPAQVAQTILRVLRQIMPELLCVLALVEAALALPRLALDTTALQVDRDVVAAVEGPVVTFPSGDLPMAVATAPARGTAFLATRHGQATPADLGRGRPGADLPAQVAIAAAAGVPFASAAWSAVGGVVPGEEEVGRALAAAGARDFLLVKGWLGPEEGARARAWAIARWGPPAIESAWGAAWRISAVDDAMHSE